VEGSGEGETGEEIGGSDEDLEGWSGVGLEMGVGIPV
jgi:hypothetical protein